MASTALTPRLIKIDVEGFELPLLQGAPELLKSVSGIIIELNGSGLIYGRSDEDVHNLLVGAGFKCFDYDVQTRALSASEGFRRGQVQLALSAAGRCGRDTREAAYLC